MARSTSRAIVFGSYVETRAAFRFDILFTIFCWLTSLGAAASISGEDCIGGLAGAGKGDTGLGDMGVGDGLAGEGVTRLGLGGVEA